MTYHIYQYHWYKPSLLQVWVIIKASPLLLSLPYPPCSQQSSQIDPVKMWINSCHSLKPVASHLLQHKSQSPYYGLQSLPIRLLTSSPAVFSLAPFIQLHWLFPEYVRHNPTSRPLHSLLTPPGTFFLFFLPPPRTFFPQIYARVILSPPSSLCSNIDQIFPFQWSIHWSSRFSIATPIPILILPNPLSHLIFLLTTCPLLTYYLMDLFIMFIDCLLH